MLYFGFTHCPDICPSELLKVAKIQQELGSLFPLFPSISLPILKFSLYFLFVAFFFSTLAKRKAPFQVKPVFISVDPARDTIAQLKHYSQGSFLLSCPLSLDIFSFSLARLSSIFLLLNWYKATN